MPWRRHLSDRPGAQRRDDDSEAAGDTPRAVVLPHVAFQIAFVRSPQHHFEQRRSSVKDGSKKFSIGMVLGLAVGLLLYRVVFG